MKTKIKSKNRNTIKKKIKKNISLKQKLKIKNLDIKQETNYNTKKMAKGKDIDYREDFIEALNKLEYFNRVHEKEFIKAKKYREAIEKIKELNEPLTDNSQIKDLPGIGKRIIEKFDEMKKSEDNKISSIEKLIEKYGDKEYNEYRENQKKKEVFLQIHGIGDAAAQKIIDLGIKTLDELKARKDEKIPGKGKKQLPILNETQQKGLKYYYELLERIPRKEIEQFHKLFTENFNETLSENGLLNENYSFEIVGSYRRGKKDSGDIDLIITSKDNNVSILKNFTEKLKNKGIVQEFLTNGEKKILAIGTLGGKNISRRIDFLYAPPEEYAFSVLYFTGSKEFNTAMRQHALSRNLTLNEHGFHQMKSGVKGEKIDMLFKTEKDIFDYLDMEYREPNMRIDANSVNIIKKTEAPGEEQPPAQEQPPGEEQPPAQEQPPGEEPKLEKTKTFKIKISKTKAQTIKNLKKSEIDTGKSNIEKFKLQGIDVLKILSQIELEDMLRIAIENYYQSENQENTILTDNEYDILREYILEKYPDSKIAIEQHTELKLGKDKVKLPYEMWSMNKIKPDTDALEKYKDKYKSPYVISCKLDGVSALYSTENGKQMLYTRGNGKFGQNINHLIEYLNLPNIENTTVRGELIINKQKFEEKYSKEFSNSRNFISGIVNRKKLDKKTIEFLKDIDLVCYEIIKPELIPSKGFKFLQDNGFNVVKYREIATEAELTNNLLSEKLLEWREDYDYMIDGIVCIHDEIYERESKNPDHAFAFKMIISEQVVEAKVVDVLWTPSKDGFLKPTVQIEPVKVDGVTIEFATGFNAKFIEDNMIGLGAIIRIIRSGHVIPHIEEVIEKASIPLMPKEDYEWNDTHVDIILKNKEEDERVSLKIISGFFKQLDVEGLGEGNVKKIIKAGFNSIDKILKMKIEDFETVENFGKKMAEKVFNSIKTSLESSPVEKIAAATNIFGRGFGEKKIKTILDNEPDVLISSETLKNKIEKVEKINGMAKLTAKKFVEKIPEFIEFLELTELKSLVEKKSSKHLDGEDKKESEKKYIDDIKKIVVLSEFKSQKYTKKQLTEEIEKIGYKVEDQPTKKTDILIVGDLSKETGKVKKANKINEKENKILIISLDDFIEKYL